MYTLPDRLCAKYEKRENESLYAFMDALPLELRDAVLFLINESYEEGNYDGRYFSILFDDYKRGYQDAFNKMTKYIEEEKENVF